MQQRHEEEEEEIRRDDQKRRKRRRRWALEETAEIAQEDLNAQQRAQDRRENEETGPTGDGKETPRPPSARTKTEHNSGRTQTTGRGAEAPGDTTGRAPVHPTPNPHVELQGPLAPRTGLPPGSSSKAPPPRRPAGAPEVRANPDTGLDIILGAMDFPGGAIKALQQDPRVWEHLGRIATAGEAGWERHFRNQVAVSLTNLGFPTEPALGTESADSPAALDEASQAFYSEEGLPTGFAHRGKGGERPPGEGKGHIARARRKRKETDAANCQTRA